MGFFVKKSQILFKGVEQSSVCVCMSDGNNRTLLRTRKRARETGEKAKRRYVAFLLGDRAILTSSCWIIYFNGRVCVCVSEFLEHEIARVFSFFPVGRGRGYLNLQGDPNI